MPTDTFCPKWNVCFLPLTSTKNNSNPFSEAVRYSMPVLCSMSVMFSVSQHLKPRLLGMKGVFSLAITLLAFVSHEIGTGDSSHFLCSVPYPSTIVALQAHITPYNAVTRSEGVSISLTPFCSSNLGYPVFNSLQLLGSLTYTFTALLGPDGRPV